MKIPKRVNVVLDQVGVRGRVRIITFLLLADVTLATGLAVKVSVAAVAWSLMVLAALAGVVWWRTSRIDRLLALSNAQNREIGRLRQQNNELMRGQLSDAVQMTARLPRYGEDR